MTFKSRATLALQYDTPPDLVFKTRLELFEGMHLKRLADSEDAVKGSFGLRALAATLHGSWGDAIESVQSAFADPRLEVRGIALLACVRMGWFTVAVVVKNAAAKETDPELRAEMTSVAGVLEKTPHVPGRSPW